MYKIKARYQCPSARSGSARRGHKRSSFCERDLAPTLTDYHPSRPEMAIGPGAPRAAIRLVKRQGEVRAEATAASTSPDKLIALASRKARQLDFLSGYILCAKSPAAAWSGCASMAPTTREHQARGRPRQGADGGQPLLPVEKMAACATPSCGRTSCCGFAYHDWQQLCARGSPPPAPDPSFIHASRHLVLSTPPPTTGRWANCWATSARPTCRRWPTATSRVDERR